MNYTPEADAQTRLIEQTAAFVQEQLRHAEAGHDWWHIQRVWQNTRLLLDHEAPGPDRLTCELAALLHDIADSKFHQGDESLGPKIAGDFLRQQGVEADIIEHVQQIIRHMSFKSTLRETQDLNRTEAEDHPATFHSPELELVQDADRLDALGAIGIARAFHYGGYKNRELYNPSIPPQINQTKEAYKTSTAPTINHFYEKLLLLTEKMNTATARKIAAQRHQYMEGFLEQFMKEWDGISD